MIRGEYAREDVSYVAWQGDNEKGERMRQDMVEGKIPETNLLIEEKSKKMSEAAVLRKNLNKKATSM